MHANMRSFRTHCFDGLQIRFGYLLGSIVSVTYFVTAQLAFSANFTCTGHSHILQDAMISVPFYAMIGAYHTIRARHLQVKSLGAGCYGADQGCLTREEKPIV